MKIALILAAALLATFVEADSPTRLAAAHFEAAGDPFPITASFGGMPPERFMDEALVPVGFVYLDSLAGVCGRAEPPLVRLGCATDKAIAVIHPCAPAFKGELFAQIMCHEIAHVNHWPATHGP